MKKSKTKRCGASRVYGIWVDSPRGWADGREADCDFSIRLGKKVLAAWWSRASAVKTLEEMFFGDRDDCESVRIIATLIILESPRTKAKKGPAQ